MSFTSTKSGRRKVLGFLTLVTMALSSSFLQAQEPRLRLNGPMGSDTANSNDSRSNSSPEGKTSRRSRKFTATGKLHRVRSKETGSERYALMDRRGDILAFVAPSSRHDFEDYLGDTINVTARTFGRDDDVAPYIMVDKILLSSRPTSGSSVRQAAYESPMEPMMMPGNGPVWRSASTNRMTGSSNGGCATCGDPRHTTGMHEMVPSEMQGSTQYSGPTFEGPHGNLPPMPGERYVDDPNLGMPAGDGQFSGPSYGQGNFNSPQFGEPIYAEPVYNEPIYAEPQYGEPQYGEPQYGQPQYGQPQYGEPNYLAHPRMAGPMMGGPMMGGPIDSTCMGGCGTSTSCSTCGIGMPCCCPPSCGPPGWLWLRGEYLLWFSDKLDLPPLITTSDTGTAAGDAGVLGEESTQILYGNDGILSKGRSGFRISFGGFFGPSRKLGWEAEYLDIGDIDATVTFSGDGTGSPIIARPFYNLNTPGEDAELVSFPGILTGDVTVDSYSRFSGAGGRFRYTKCCKQSCDPCHRRGPFGGHGMIGACGPCGYPPYCKIDFTAGYRHYHLEEGVSISEDLTSLQAQNPGRFELTDNFRTQNDFDGAELGTVYSAGRNRWTFEFLTRIAIGNTQQRASIDGETTISPLVSPAETFEGGLLALPSNIGEYSRDRFTMIPELGLNLGFYMSPRMRVLIGYNMIYWGNVVRPGEIIDLVVDTDQVPPALENVADNTFPRFNMDESDFWAQGLNVGLDYRW